MYESALLGVFDEVEYVLDLVGLRQFFLDHFEGVGQCESALENDSVGFVDGVDDVSLEAASTQSYDVEAAVCCRVACADCVGQYALWRACASAHHCIASDAAELVHEHAGREDGVVVDGHFSCELGAVADDDIVAYDVVVRDVAAFHEQVAASYYGLTLGCSASVDGYVLADLIVVANDGESVFAAELEVLGDTADDTSRMEDVAVSDACTIKDGYAVHQRVVVANLHTAVDVAEGAYFNVLANLGFGMYIC